MTERIDSNKILKVINDKGVINLLITLKCIVIVVNTDSLVWNIPHYMRFVFCETNFIYSKYTTEVATYRYI